MYFFLHKKKTIKNLLKNITNYKFIDFQFKKTYFLLLKVKKNILYNLLYFIITNYFYKYQKKKLKSEKNNHNNEFKNQKILIILYF